MHDTFDDSGQAPATTAPRPSYRPGPSVLAYYPDLEHVPESLWQRVYRSTFLPGADPVQVWQGATEVVGINAELSPVMRMTLPKQMQGIGTPSLARVPLGQPLGRSWILLGGCCRTTTTTSSSPSGRRAALPGGVPDVVGSCLDP